MQPLFPATGGSRGVDSYGPGAGARFLVPPPRLDRFGLGRAELRDRRGAAPDRRRRPRRQVQPHRDVRRVGPSSPPPAAAPRVEFMYETGRRCPPTGPWRPSPGGAAGSSGGPARPSSGCRRILEEGRGPRHARVRRRVVGFRAAHENAPSRPHRPDHRPSPTIALLGPAAASRGTSPPTSRPRASASTSAAMDYQVQSSRLPGPAARGTSRLPRGPARGHRAGGRTRSGSRSSCASRTSARPPRSLPRTGPRDQRHRGHVFRPIPLAPEINPFAYVPGRRGAARRLHPGRGLGGGREPDPGLDGPVQARPSRAGEPPPGARDRRRGDAPMKAALATRRVAALGVSLRSAPSGGGEHASPAGAAVAPPPPWPDEQHADGDPRAARRGREGDEPGVGVGRVVGRRRRPRPGGGSAPRDGVAQLRGARLARDRAPPGCPRGRRSRCVTTPCM